MKERSWVKKTQLILTSMKKKILILGASSDIGIATTMKFLKNDWHVVAHCNQNSSKLLKLKKKFTLNLEILKIDLNEISKLPKILNKNKKKLNKVVSFVSLVGLLKKSNYQKINYKLFLSHVNVNFFSNLIFINFLIKNMIKNKWGRILLSSSIGTKFGGGKDSYYYSLSKHMNEFVPSIFKKTYANYILYNVLQIGVTDTKIHTNLPKKNLNLRKKLIPIKRIAKTKEVAEKIFFMASDKNTLIHSQIINISGGE